MVLALLIAALVCFLVAAISGWAPTNGAGWTRINFVALGLAFLTIVQLTPLLHG